MVGYYRLKELGFKLSAGGHILSQEEFAPIEGATALLADAEKRAAEIVASAQVAYRRESVRGYEDGMAKARLEAAERLLQESSVLDARLRDMERDLAVVVAAAVRKLIDGFDDHARAEAAVRGALKQMRREKKAELRVASAQFAHFRGAIAGIIKDFPEVELIDVIEDGTLTPPQIILETSIGRVEGDFGRHLDDLQQILQVVAAQRAQGEAREAEGGEATSP